MKTKVLTLGDADVRLVTFEDPGTQFEMFCGFLLAFCYRLTCINSLDVAYFTTCIATSDCIDRENSVVVSCSRL